MAWWVWVLRLGFAALMLATGIGKLLDMPGFYAVVDSYRVLAGWMIPPSAWALALTELALGIWLIVGPRIGPLHAPLHWAAAIIVAMHVVYWVWLAIALARGLELDNCGCFGVFLARPLTSLTLVEDGVLLGAAVLFWWGCWRNRSGAGAGGRSRASDTP